MKMKIKMIARWSGEEKNKNHPKSSNKYLLINSKSVWSFAYIEKGY